MYFNFTYLKLFIIIIIVVKISAFVCDEIDHTHVW